MRYGSVSSGIEAASVAFMPLGWEPAWLSEIDIDASLVLSYRLGATAPKYLPSPDEPGLSEKERKDRKDAIRKLDRATWNSNLVNFGDMNILPELIMSGEAEAPDLLCGGTPCQGFSVAGNRRGLFDPRGQLTLTFVKIADAIDEIRRKDSKPECIIYWENVPGVLSDKGNAFGHFLAALVGEDCALVPSGKGWTNAGIVSGPKRTIAWRVGDAQYFGLAQRRKRVVLVASARDDFDPGEVLFEFDGARRDTAPRRLEGKDFTGTAGYASETESCDVGSIGKSVRLNTVCVDTTQISSPANRSNPQVNDPCHSLASGQHPPALFAFGEEWPRSLASTLNASFGSKLGLENQHILSGCAQFVPCYWNNGQISQTLDAVLSKGKMLPEKNRFPVVMTPILEAGARTGVSSTDSRSGCGIGQDGDPMFTLQATKQHAIAFSVKDSFPGAWHNISPTLRSMGHSLSHMNGGGQVGVCHPFEPCSASKSSDGDYRVVVRRLMPVECERLQGFPDDWTLVPVGNRMMSDSARYKQIGNSWAVPHHAWVGRRIQEHLDSLETEIELDSQIVTMLYLMAA